MKCISEEFVEETWQSAAQMDPEDAAQGMFAMSEAQPELLAFVLSVADELGDDAAELTTYLLFVLYRIFRNAADEELPAISTEQIEAKYTATCDVFESLDEDAAGAAEAFMDKSNQPHVNQYLIEALFEEGVDEELEEDEMEISDENLGEVFLLLKCVIDLFDEVAA